MNRTGKTNKSHKKRGEGAKFIVFLCLTALFIFLALKYIDSRVMPPVIKTMEAYGENESLKAIDSAVTAVIGRSGIKTSDLYTKSDAPDGRLMSLAANTILINSLCADVAEEAVSRLEKLDNETIYLPLGVITGFDFLAAKGPPVFGITVKPVGRCNVDYKTSFKSEGINQVNYQIWLEIKSDISVVNPIINRSFTVSRRLPIVNTYISGEVPQSMLFPFKIDGSGE